MKCTFEALAPAALPPPPPRLRKARAFMRPVRLLVVALLLMGAFAGFGAFLVGLGGMIALGTQGAGMLALGGMSAFVLGKMGAFALSRSLSCALCHGPVMQERGCHKHAEATQIPLLSHRGAVVATVLTTGTFRCMYCGTPYKLRK